MGLFGTDPSRQLRKRYKALMTEARDRQRQGDIQGAASVHAQADEVYAQLQAMEAGSGESKG